MSEPAREPPSVASPARTTESELDAADEWEPEPVLEPDPEDLLAQGHFGGPVPARITADWSRLDAEHVDPVERIADLLRRWELGSVYRLRAAAHHAVLSEPEYLVLSELAIRPYGLSGAELSGIVGLGSGGVSQLLTRLEEQELVERTPDPRDGRSVLTIATDAGRDLLRFDVGDVADAEGVATLLTGLRPFQVELVAEFLSNAANRSYRQSRQLRDVRVRRR